MDVNELMGAIEAILFVAGEPVEEESLRMALEILPDALEEALRELASRYDYERRGIRLLRFGKSVQLSTRPDYADYVERLLQPIQRQNLSQAAMETLAVIAYRQPATRGDVEAVRGVKCDYSVQSLLNKGLIMEAGKRDTLGKPTLFATTDLFLRHFGISSLEELPEIDFSGEKANAEEEGEEELAQEGMEEAEKPARAPLRLLTNEPGEGQTEETESAMESDAEDTTPEAPAFPDETAEAADVDREAGSEDTLA